VLVGVDTASSYCFLLSLEEHRDADTLGRPPLELVIRASIPSHRCRRRQWSRAGQAGPSQCPCQAMFPHRPRSEAVSAS
jgi:hypothetical protein